jgi:cytochrome P450
LAATIITIPNKLYFRKFWKLIDPEIHVRLAEFERRAVNPEKKTSEPERNDYLQWHINYAKKTSMLSELKPRMIASRIMMMNFAAIHTTTFSMTNMIFDIVSSDPQLRLVEQLRQEVETVLAEDQGQWTKHGVLKMVKIDSALRESQRINSMLSFGLERKVMAPEGVTTPQGVYCPAGSIISVPANGIHNDPSIFTDADQFKPFRFANLRDDIGRDNNPEGILKRANYGFVTTSTEYLPFGHGRHACPGRFFAANELKLMLAYMVLNYDFEIMETRPPNKWMSTILFPPMKEKIRVRRRKVATKV